MESVPNPLIDLSYTNDMADAPDADPLAKYYRNVSFFTGHIIFFTCNFLNVFYMVLIQGLALRNLFKSRLLQLTLVGCFLQMMSCMTSLTRLSMNDEYSGWGKAGSALSYVGYNFMNYSCSYVIFKSNTKPILITTSVGTLIAIVAFVLEQITWDETNFLYFRIFVGITTFFQCVSMYFGYHHLKKETISTDPSIISNDAMKRLFLVLFATDVLCIATMFSKLPYLLYPFTGVSYIVVVVMATYVSKMEFAITTTSGTEEENKEILTP